MNAVTSSPSQSRRRLPAEPFAGAERVVFEQAETFSAADDFVLPALAAVSPEATCGVVEETRDESDYYDTVDLALANAGIDLRYSVTDQIWLVMMPTVSSAGEPIRREAHYAGPVATVPADALGLLHPTLHRNPVARVAHVVTERAVTPLLTRSGTRIADVIDEHVEASRLDGSQAKFRDIDVVVLDLDGVGHDLLLSVRALLEGSGCRLVPPRAELARAFGPLPPNATS